MTRALRQIHTTCCILLAGTLTSCASAAARPVSQRAEVRQRVGATEISVTYGRPAARGRSLFGALVPWGVVWNPGADEASAIHFSRAVLLNGQRLDAGAYSIWAIPDSLRWTVILSRAANVYHEPYPEGRDALRTTVAVEQGPFVESLQFSFPVASADSATLALQWGTTLLRFPLRPARARASPGAA